MNRNILFARIGWGNRYVGEDLTGNFREPTESNSWAERFNFTVGPGNRCYGYVPPMGPHKAAPNRAEKCDFLVILCSKRTEYERLNPVGWYENATFEVGYVMRPSHPGLQPSLRPKWNELEYCFSTDAARTFWIPVEKRAAFDAVPTFHFRRSFVYARYQGNDDYPELVASAERILAMKHYSQSLEKPNIGVLMKDLQEIVARATNALENEDGITTEEARKRILASILDRPNQARFRETLMRTYRSRCTISECDCQDVLEAAHIIPVSEGGSDHVTNGLLLRADLHRLFDLKKLSIHPIERIVVIAPELKGTIYEQYDGKPLLAASKPTHKPDGQHLRRHFDSAGL